MNELLDRNLHLKIKSLYESTPRRFKGRRSGNTFSLTDKETGEIFKGHHTDGYYAYGKNGGLELVQEWNGPFFCTTDEVKELYEIVSNRQETRRLKLMEIKLEKLQNKKLTYLKKAYEG